MPRIRPKQLAQDGATNGQPLKWNNALGIWAPAAPGGGAANDILTSFATDGAPYVNRNLSASYASLGTIYFRGTTALGAPANIKIVMAASTASPTHSLRIFDVTHGLQIAEMTGMSLMGLHIGDMGALTNLPTGETILEVQGKRDGGGNLNFSLYAMAILF